MSVPYRSSFSNYVHHEGMGVHLSVNLFGVVSLWDTKALAQSAPGEAYVFLDLTEAQVARLDAATRKATPTKP